MSDDPQKASGEWSFPWGWALVVGIGVFVVASQSGSQTATSPDSVDALAETPTGSPVPTADPPIEDAPLKLAARHAGMALGADGLTGANAYSVNCWASLERSFALAKAEQCSAFDAMVASSVENPVSNLPPWFAESAVASRYQTLLSANQVAITDIPARLERLRLAAAIQTVKVVTPKPPKPVEQAAADFEDEPGGDAYFGVVDNASIAD